MLLNGTNQFKVQTKLRMNEFLLYETESLPSSHLVYPKGLAHHLFTNANSKLKALQTKPQIIFNFILDRDRNDFLNKIL